MSSNVEVCLKSSEFGVLVGPLRHELSTDELAKRVFQLFNSLGIRCTDIARVSINAHVGYARVELCTRECEEYALKILREVRSLMSLYDLRKLTAKPKYFVAQRLFPPSAELMELIGFSKVMVHKENNNPIFKSMFSPLSGDDSHLLKHLNLRKSPSDNKDFQLVSLPQSQTNSQSTLDSLPPPLPATPTGQTLKLHAATATDVTTGAAVDGRVGAADGGRAEKKKPAMVSAKTSTQALEPCFYPGTNFYHRLQTLERAEPNYHYNQGDILTNDLRGFRTMIGKFICAFLNTNGGVLYFGVTKTGQVQGVTLTHRYEDALRLDIDGQVKLIEPIVPTSAYYINFAKVMDTTGHLLPDLKVLQVKVRPPEHAQTTFTYKSVAYFWKDAKVVDSRAKATGKEATKKSPALPKSK